MVKRKLCMRCGTKVQIDLSTCPICKHIFSYSQYSPKKDLANNMQIIKTAYSVMGLQTGTTSYTQGVLPHERKNNSPKT